MLASLLDRIDAHWANTFALDRSDLFAQEATITIDDAAGDGVLMVGFPESVHVLCAEQYADWVRKWLDESEPGQIWDREAWESVSGLPVASAKGPTAHYYADAIVADGPRDERIVELDESELGDFARVLGVKVWDEARFGEDLARYFGIRERGELLAVANLTEWDGKVCEVALGIPQKYRGHGLGTAVARVASEVAVRDTGMARIVGEYSDYPLRRMASEFGFEPYGYSITATML